MGEINRSSDWFRDISRVKKKVDSGSGKSEGEDLRLR